jgi:2,4-dienoyl-CoA reductase-like NADH-dependent reductase (Old Yellow Enzyme family)
MSQLLKPIKFGSIELKNRIVMAPLTRSRATGDDGRTPNDLMLKYYVQRASAGLIIAEATAITPMGVGYANTPGIWSEAHVDGWKKITDAVHEAGGKIVSQLWHVGRVSHPMFLSGATAVAPSAIRPDGFVSIVRPKTPFETPRALELSEIPVVIESYRRAAENAKRAGFDGVEIHGANGYLIDQFLQDRTNKRTDEYGGSIENRARFMLEVTDAVISVWGADKVGMHIAPRGGSNHISDSNPLETFSYAVRELGKRRIAFLFVRESRAPGFIGPRLKAIFKGPYIANEGLTVDDAHSMLRKSEADAVSFGRLFIANPDLVRRIEERYPLNTPIPETFYSPGEIGYTDYPTIEETNFKRHE